MIPSASESRALEKNRVIIHHSVSMISSTIFGSKTPENQTQQGKGRTKHPPTPSLAPSCLTVIESSTDWRAPHTFLPAPNRKSLEDWLALSLQERACCCQRYMIQIRNECTRCRHLHLRLASATTLWVRTVTTAAASALNATIPAWEHTSALTVETLNRLTVTQHGRTRLPP